MGTTNSYWAEIRGQGWVGPFLSYGRARGFLMCNIPHVHQGRILNEETLQREFQTWQKITPESSYGS